MSTATYDSAVSLLRRLTGNPGAGFRPGQWEAIERLVEGRGRALVVQRTGWGKSAVYLVATRLLRDRGAGPTLLISPLLALMRNQLLMARRAGVRADSINSQNRDGWDGVEARVRAGEVDLLLISPERLQNDRFRRDVLPGLVRSVGLLVVDEAHCISDWGHDFRPDYRRIARVLRLLPRGVPVLCTTATANDRVVEDIVDQLGDGLDVVRGPLDRESLALGVVDLPEQAARLAWLARTIPTLPGSGIVYCLTVADTERVAGWLRSRGIEAVAYSGESDPDGRLLTEQALLDNEVKAVVATSALGMGFDKPDLTFVIHYQAPSSALAYYQQVGRAGRAVPHAAGIMLRGREDRDIQDYFIRTAFPPPTRTEQLVDFLEARAEPVTRSEIEAAVNARRTRIDAMLKILEVEGAVERLGGRYRRTLVPWAYDVDRAERVTALRREEQDAMVAYARTGGCRMAWLRGALDDAAADPCGRCDNCTGVPVDATLDPALVAAASAHLRAASRMIDPRRMWPSGALPSRKGKIPDELRLEPGRVLSVYGDGGWGTIVKLAKYHDHHYPDDLVEATVRLLGEWSPDPAPEWLTCVPSTSNPGLVPDFAGRVAAALGIELVDAVSRVRPGPPQKDMENSAQQLRNVHDAFEVTKAPAGPVLLIDDIIDSGWTLTTVGVALREAGSGPVYPFALAKAVST
jgi:ATP-dependent DNA helicase RecQ